MSGEKREVACIIGGKEVRTGQVKKSVMPHSHREVTTEFHWATQKEMQMAIDAALAAKPAWEALPWHQRAAVFLKAAELFSTTYRDTINAATMLGQSKNAWQSEIDAVAENCDFLRFNAHFYEQILSQQPISSPGVWNRLEQRPLEGFVAAITPFNFTAIAANLPATPALLGNTVVWKPSDTQMLSASIVMEVFKKAGLPDGVINLVPADGALTGETLLKHPSLAGVHFTGSTQTFRSIWKTVGENLNQYRSYPRLVGETGGKDFVFVHPSADWEAAACGMVRGAFEYQGQKCSAASRAYIPKSLWPQIKEKMISEISSIRVGDVRDFRNFVNAVIDERSFDKIMGYLELAANAKDAQVLAGGHGKKDVGYFIEPTLILTENPYFKTMQEEIFGPVLTVYVYEDVKLEETLTLCDQTSPYALTGAVFAQDRAVVDHLTWRLRNSAGNFYVNDKPTGAVVGQQPFGGARASGTNDKAGSILNLYRWLSPRTIKEVQVPPRDYRYPFMLGE